jgi:transcriptional regulator with XRE-family HTH domain
MSAQSKNRRTNTMALLKSSGLRSNEFSARIGVMPSYFGQIKKGRANGGRDIGDAVAKRIEQAFGLPEFWLDHDSAEKSQYDSPLSHNQRALLRLSDELTPEQVKQVLAYGAGLYAAKN